MIIKRTKTKALQAAKEILKAAMGVKKARFNERPAYCQCGCGQSPAVSVSAWSANKFKSVIVGICRRCGDE